ncbi:MAG: hypothetical protein QOF55_1544 [Thermoleophilaceae bacterium]|nr:hypothetical protein [Thermoleophilaceae bacterium]
MLGLRAGLDGAPQSRRDAALQLGISVSRAARLERRGLRTLNATCGGSQTSAASQSAGGGATARVISLAGAAPALQPATYLPAAATPAAGSHPRGSQAVKGETATSSPSSSGNGPISVAATQTSFPAGRAGTNALPLVLAVCLAALATLLLVAQRRRVLAQPRGPRMTATVAAPVAAPRRAAPAVTDAGEGGAATAQTAAIAAPGQAAATEQTAATAATGQAAATEQTAATSAGPESAPATTAPAGTTPAGTAPAKSTPSLAAPGWPGPSADQQAPTPASTASPTANTGSSTQRLARSASAVASGVVSFAVRELMRRRGRR